jgi:hypothetical protein
MLRIVCLTAAQRLSQCGRKVEQRHAQACCRSRVSTSTTGCGGCCGCTSCCTRYCHPCLAGAWKALGRPRGRSSTLSWSRRVEAVWPALAARKRPTLLHGGRSGCWLSFIGVQNLCLILAKPGIRCSVRGDCRLARSSERIADSPLRDTDAAPRPGPVRLCAKLY